ncbi:Protein of unknown function [Cotesia congregata]|uniref:Uncharacterized protein n=1 Tax=Cotesia congregata TaxID=51543 RepID=A0A8J2HC07_COTCN|nr:Protein of unknown function [Cotesia congregata]
MRLQFNRMKRFILPEGLQIPRIVLKEALELIAAQNLLLYFFKSGFSDRDPGDRFPGISSPVPEAFNLLELELFSFSDRHEAQRSSLVFSSSSSSGAMYVRIYVLGKVKVNDIGDKLEIYTTSHSRFFVFASFALLLLAVIFTFYHMRLLESFLIRSDYNVVGPGVELHYCTTTRRRGNGRLC